jgi:hypothetical protein
VAAAAQRSAAEPRGERFPTAPVLSLLDRGQRLMAHLSVVRLTLAGPWAASAGPALTDSLAKVHLALTHLLANTAMANTEAAEGNADGTIANSWSDGKNSLPLTALELDRMPWLQRRLGVLQKDARAVQQAAWAIDRPHS